MFESTYMLKTCKVVMDDVVNLDHDYFHVFLVVYFLSVGKN